MKLTNYLNMLRWDGDIAARVIRVKDLNDLDNVTCYDVVIFPQEMDEESGVSYRVDTDIEEIKERIELWPTQFAVLGAWSISDLVKGAMYMSDTVVTDYFESEV